MSAESSVYLGTGRRKTSTARVRLVAGSGQLSVNDRKFETYFTHENFVRRAVAPLTTADAKEKFDVFVNVAGGGISSQSGAVAHGIARALLKFNPELRVTLKKAGHLTRDPREKERKKAGQPGARKRFQFSKR
ncbi:30S ribosomal protein S9 [Oleiharenicola lentus]|jgi:small subunit ribosomal protein S9|uniref:Small ribosomal subunit protein uS9 n=1 Tax=Oleiharenicola lentus TaxID=2508720 RepID=A0A4Q1C6W0_9BACT|nr:30S ribosomal protein S9 [Oleiharenicola lentus]RXK54627.1 30S ribosomal protein S9 [Oleiharenicola lentus]